MKEAFAYIIGLGPSVMMPVIFTILGVLIGIEFVGLKFVEKRFSGLKGFSVCTRPILVIGHWLQSRGVGHKLGGSEIDKPLDYLKALLCFRKLSEEACRTQDVSCMAFCF